MANKRKSGFKINGDTMSSIVIYSLLFCVSIVIVGLILAAAGVDASSIVDSALRVFGTELGICGVMTIFQRWTAAQDKRAERAAERRREERERRREERERKRGM